nr:MAG TPA: hypothetical protein [Caudoviricetes sp.]
MRVHNPEGYPGRGGTWENPGNVVWRQPPASVGAGAGAQPGGLSGAGRNLGEPWERSVAPATGPYYIYGFPSPTGRGSLLENM